MGETGVVVFGIAILVLLVFSPLILQLWRVAKNLTKTLEELNARLPGILDNLEHITATVRSASDVVYRELEDLSVLSRKIQSIVAIGDDIEKVLLTGVKLPLMEAMKILRAVFKGVRVFTEVIVAKSSASQEGDRQCHE